MHVCSVSKPHYIQMASPQLRRAPGALKQGFLVFVKACIKAPGGILTQGGLWCPGSVQPRAIAPLAPLSIATALESSTTAPFEHKQLEVATTAKGKRTETG